jgi:excinuclease ABC subunit A
MEKTHVDYNEGLSPAISIEQKSTSRNPRSTVGTVTEVYDYLRLLFATVGKPHCFNCGKGIASQSASQIADRVMKLPAKSRVEILAPVVRGRKGEYRRELADLRKQGFVRVRIDGETMELSGDVRLSRNVNHEIEVVVDRLLMRSGIDKRLSDSLEVALKLADDTVIVASRPPGTGSHWSEETFSRKFACADCGVSYPEITPRMFSFNSPHGACPDCNGVGKSTAFDPTLLIADAKLAVSKGAIAPWGKRLTTKYALPITKICEAFGATASTAYEDLPEGARELILHGPAGGDAPTTAPGGLARGRRFPGILPLLMRRYRESESDFVRTDLERFMSEMVCETCEGKRLRREAYHVLVSKTPIHEISGLPVGAALERLRGLKLGRKEQEIAKLVLREIIERLEFMIDVGLGYLSLDRPTGTLSGGESQRIRLATQIGAGLSGVLYVLDEPSIGLHPRDNHRLLESLRKLTDSGNSVIVVEHDADTILAADYVVDMGPGAGVTGGHIVSSGTPADVMQDAASLTGGYLVGRESIPVPADRKTGAGQCLTIRGATHHNLKDVTVEIPLGRMTCVTGVSGSGKSSLVVDTLHAALANQLHGASHEVGTAESVEGIDQVDKVIDIDQAPIGRTPRSNPATYTGLFTDIRDLFAMLPESRMRGYTAGRFSFNVKGGRCDACNGDGMLRIGMHFLPDIYVLCDVCGGRRYNRETLQVHYKGKNIADVLEMTVGEAKEFLSSIPSAKRKLDMVSSVGLDYVHLGQSATTLSGGEAQRIKLAKELARRATGKTVYILDEPTTGLHFADVKNLLEVLGRLVEAGNTVIDIEHHIDVIKTADYVIDIGPEGGDQGGEVVVAGTPEEVAACSESHTGRFLLEALGRKAA